MFSNQNSTGWIRGIRVTWNVENAATSPTLVVMGIGGMEALDQLSNKMVMSTMLSCVVLNQVHQKLARMGKVTATKDTRSVQEST